MYLSTIRNPLSVFRIATLLVPPSPEEIQAAHQRNLDLGPVAPPNPSRFGLTLQVRDPINLLSGTARPSELPKPDAGFQLRLTRIGDRVLAYVTEMFDPAVCGIEWLQAWEFIVGRCPLPEDVGPPGLVVEWEDDSIVLRGFGPRFGDLRFSAAEASVVMGEVLVARDDFSQEMNLILERLHQLDRDQFEPLPANVIFPEKIKIGCFGCVNSGKSTLLNRLLAETVKGFKFSEICPMDDSPFTVVIWKINYGATPKCIYWREIEEEEGEGEVEVEGSDQPREIAYEKKEIKLKKKTYRKKLKTIMVKIRHHDRFPKFKVRPIVEIQLPHPLLKLLTFVDLPGVDEEEMRDLVYKELVTCHTICFVIDASNATFSTGEKQVLKMMKERFAQAQGEAQGDVIISSMSLMDKLVFIGNKLDKTLPQMIFDDEDSEEGEESSDSEEEEEEEEGEEVITLDLLKSMVEKTRKTILDVVRDPVNGISPDFPQERVLLTVAKRDVLRKGMFSAYFRGLLFQFIRDMLRASEDTLFHRPTSRLLETALRTTTSLYDRRVAIKDGVYDALQRRSKLVALKPKIVLALVLFGFQKNRELVAQFEKSLFSTRGGAWRTVVFEKMLAVEISAKKSKSQAASLYGHALAMFLQTLLKRIISAAEIETWSALNQILVEVGHFQLLDLDFVAAGSVPTVEIGRDWMFKRLARFFENVFTRFRPDDLAWKKKTIASLLDRSKRDFFAALSAGLQDAVQPIIEECIRIVTDEIAGLTRELELAEELDEDAIRESLTKLLKNELDLLSLRRRFAPNSLLVFPPSVCQSLCSGIVDHVPEAGAGAFGTVTRLRSVDGDLFALKIFRTNVVDEHMLREVHLLRACRGLHRFPEFQGAFLVGDQLGLLMEFYDTNMENVLEDPTLGIMQRLVLALKTAEAIALMHRRRIVHRDIKPANILVDAGKKQAALADFGLAKERALLETPVAGTIAFVDPSVLSRKRPPGLPVDIYAFGLVLKQLWEGSKDILAMLSPEWALALVGHPPPDPIGVFLCPLQRDYLGVDEKIKHSVQALVLACTDMDWDVRLEIEQIVHCLTALLKEFPQYAHDGVSIAPSRNFVRKTAHAMKISYVAGGLMTRIIDSDVVVEDMEDVVARFRLEVGNFTGQLNLRQEFEKMIRRIAKRRREPSEFSGFERSLPSLEEVRVKFLDENLFKQSNFRQLQSLGFSTALVTRALFLSHGDLDEAQSWLLKASPEDVGPLTQAEWERGTEFFGDFPVRETCKAGTCSYVLIISTHALFRFSITRDTYAYQRSYLCRTCCGEENPEDCDAEVCVACATRCHPNHQLVDQGIELTYCDCGGGMLEECNCVRVGIIRED